MINFSIKDIKTRIDNKINNTELSNIRKTVKMNANASITVALNEIGNLSRAIKDRLDGKITLKDIK